MEPFDNHEQFTRLLIKHEPELLRDIEIPVTDFQARLKGDIVSAPGLELSSWLCSTTEPGLEITHVELLAP